jgi:hypothetical protein
MALKKLTLTVDQDVIEKARRYSAAHNTSISRLVGQFLARLPSGEKRYGPAVERLIGLLPPEVSVSEYHEHLEEKYGR